MANNDSRAANIQEARSHNRTKQDRQQVAYDHICARIKIQEAGGHPKNCKASLEYNLKEKVRLEVAGCR